MEKEKGQLTLFDLGKVVSSKATWGAWSEDDLLARKATLLEPTSSKHLLLNVRLASGGAVHAGLLTLQGRSSRQEVERCGMGQRPLVPTSTCQPAPTHLAPHPPPHPPRQTLRKLDCYRVGGPDLERTGLGQAVATLAARHPREVGREMLGGVAQQRSGSAAAASFA